MWRVRNQIGLTEQIAARWTGKGIGVAVLDTGIGTHPDLDSRILAFRDFVNYKDRYHYYDDSGHGTHVAGCLCGTGKCSNGKYRGIAPGCGLIVGKVLDQNGDGSIPEMINGIKWVLSLKNLYHIKILNISIGISKIENKYYEDALQKQLQEAHKAGLLVVVAAGNKGPAPMSVSSIAVSSDFLTVGCNDGNYKCDHLCEKYSGRGPTKEQIKKPDVVAPGTDIISCNKNMKGYQNAYISKCGTSMSTPIVSGVAALYMEKYPEMSNLEIKRKICINARDLGEPWNKQGWGMVNVGAIS